MVIRRFKLWVYSFVVFVTCTITATVFADDDEYYSTWEAQMNGNYRLVWYYKTKEDFHKNQPNKVLAHTKEFFVRPDVRPPTINGVYLLQHSKVNKGEDVLDLGTGTGLHAIYAAGIANHIVATDIYPPAIENAKTNAKLHGVEDEIDFRVGDLFKPVKEGEKFDVFFININFPFAVGNDRQRLHERFFSNVHKYMKPNARIYFQTSFVKNIPAIYEMLEHYKFRIMEMHMEHLPEHKHEPLFLMVQQQK